MTSGSLGNFTSSLFNGQDYVGEVSVSLSVSYQTVQNNLKVKFGQEIRVTSFSPPSERCSPLAVLHTICSEGPLFKMHSSQQLENKPLIEFWTSCLKEAKTAMLPMDDGIELHVVAMNSKSKSPCFWVFSVAEGLYASFLSMLNLRCLAMVFDLDETLIVANTMRSFEDRVDVLERKLHSEPDPQKQLEISAELKRYQEDRTILKQYAESDQVFENGRLLKTQQEVVPPSANGLLPIFRPIIRIPDRNIVLTRIHPSIRDTSVLVRLRPAWEELKGYVLAKGRKRFEVFICTMSERDYALEMWRLLDPEGRLIESRELQERLVCVKSGSKKSLSNVFARGRCFRRLAMIIDDRLKVWEDQDQAHVHVVPAFAPYYAPQAETSLPLPILCIARNVACSVRNSFFKEFDENLSQELGEAHYDSDCSLLPEAPDASKFLVFEEDMMPLVVGNGSRDFTDGMADSEVEARINPQVEDSKIEHSLVQPDKQVQSLSAPTGFQMQSSPEIQIDKSFTFSAIQSLVPSVSTQFSWQLLPFQNPPAQEEGELPESEIDPDTRRRLLILQHGQDTGHVRVAEKVDDPIYRTKPPLQIRIPTGASPGGWLGEEELSPGQPGRSSPGILLEPESPSFETQHVQPSTFGHIIGSSNERALVNMRQPEKTILGELRPRTELNALEYSSPVDENEELLRTLASKLQTERQLADPVLSLKEIAQASNAVVEYKSQLNKTTHLQFAVEVSLNGMKIGEGIGRSNREARLRAAEDAICFLASDPRGQNRHLCISSRSVGSPYFLEDDRLASWSASEHYNSTGSGPGTMLMEEGIQSVRPIGKVICRPCEDSNLGSFNAVTTLKDLCAFEGLAMSFSQLPLKRSERSKIFTSQVEVAGKVFGKGSGLSWEISEQEAAKEALRNLKPSHLGVPMRRTNTPRSPPLQASKRLRTGELLSNVSSIPASPGQNRSRVSPKRFTKVGTPMT